MLVPNWIDGPPPMGVIDQTPPRQGGQMVTSVPFDLYDPSHAQSPLQLVPDWRYFSKNADIPYKGVAPVGPQAGTDLHIRENLGSVELAGYRRYLAETGQKEVGVLPRVLAINPAESWDTPYAINPTTEVL